MRNLTPEPRPWEVLAERGAHFVLCRPDKRAVSAGWQKTRPDLEAVIAHARSPGHVGVIPASLGCVVIDVDEGGKDAFQTVEDVLGDPVTWTTTQREGGYHLWFKDVSGAGNRKWQLPAGSGDVRGAKGYAIAWDVAKIAAGLVANYDNAAQIDLSLLPKPKRGGATGAEAVTEALPGDRNNALNREAYRAASRGSLNEPAFRDAALRAGLAPAEVDATLASAKAGAMITPTFPRRDKDALERGLSIMGVALRYNVRRQRAEIKNGTHSWCDLTDRSAGHLRTELERRFRYQTARDTAPLNFGENTWAVCVNSMLHDNEIDPFKTWIEALPMWDGIERVRHWIDDCFEVDPQGDRDLIAWASQFVFLGPVWRTFLPGTKLDESVVLSGNGGIGKSTALRLALPKNIEGLFGDGLHLAAREQDRAEALQGKVIVEASEMAGSSRAELESLKSFLTRTDDGTVRLAYRRNPEPSPRRCVIIGTTNVADPLPNDPSGNRRFVVIRLKSGDVRHVVQYLEGNREQLWAEAVALYRQGVEAWLPRELARVQSVANEAARRRDELLEDALDRLLPDAGDSFTLASMATRIGLIDPGNSGVGLAIRDQRRLAAALTARGFERKVDRQGGKNVRIWKSAQ